MRALGALVVLLFVVGCASTQGPQPKVAGDYKLYEAASTPHGSTVIAVIDSRSRSTVRTLPIGTPSSDWNHLYSVIGTSLVDTNPLTGTTQGTVLLPGSYQLPPATYTGLPGGLSPDGRWLVLESFDRSAGGSATATHLLLVDTSTLKIKHQIDLIGYFAFDALSNDGQRLYLIQYLNGTEYYVRLYDVQAGQLDANIVVDKADGNQAMVGQRLTGLAGLDGHWLLSMYVRQHDRPFIHALGLDGAFAFCVDLPGSGFASDPAQFNWSIALSPDGKSLYAANTATGTVTEIDTQQPQLKRTAHITLSAPSALFPNQTAQAKESGANAAVVSPDGKTLVVGGTTGVVWIDTATLQVRSQALTEWRIWSLGLSPDGHNLYAINDAGSIAEISMGSASVVARFDPAQGQTVELMRVAAA
jgi:DNA-binding beta-propeller fold protein YncE